VRASQAAAPCSSSSISLLVSPTVASFLGWHFLPFPCAERFFFLDIRRNSRTTIWCWNAFISATARFETVRCGRAVWAPSGKRWCGRPLSALRARLMLLLFSLCGAGMPPRGSNGASPSFCHFLSAAQRNTCQFLYPMLSSFSHCQALFFSISGSGGITGI